MNLFQADQYYKKKKLNYKLRYKDWKLENTYYLFTWSLSLTVQFTVTLLR